MEVINGGPEHVAISVEPSSVSSDLKAITKDTGRPSRFLVKMLCENTLSMDFCVAYYYSSKMDTDLNSYYYGTFEGRQIKDFSFPDPGLQCPKCQHVFTSTKDILSHAYHHIIQKSFCHYCLDDSIPIKYMKLHEEACHEFKMMEKDRFSCRICEKHWASAKDLTIHMWTLHKKQDLPYICTVCEYRTSFRYDLFHHFEEDHQKSDIVLCPKCIKGYRIRNSSGILRFLSHLVAHQKANGQQCERCALTFTDCVDWLSHYSNKCHESVDISGVKLDYNRGIKMAKPPVCLQKLEGRYEDDENDED